MIVCNKGIFCCLILILGLSAIDIPAQNKNQSNISILFCITDSASGKPVEFANIIILNSIDSSYYTGGVSSADGTIKFNSLQPGNYYANISFLGYKTETISSIFISANSTLHLSYNVILKPQSVSLSPVTVSARKEIIVYEDNKIIYNASRDTLNFGGSAFDVLENAPMVKIDIDDNVSLVGRRSVTVFVNEMSLSRLGMTSKDYLKTIHWSEVERIEIMHNPTDEFSTNNGGGAINIVLKKKENNKYSGYVDASGTTKNEYDSGVGLNYRLKKFNIRASYSGDYSDFNIYTDTYRENILSGSPAFLQNNKDAQSKSRKNFYRLGISYLPDNHISFYQTAYFNSRNNRISTNTFNKYYDTAYRIVNNISSEIVSDNQTDFFNYSLNFMKTFPGSKQKITSIFYYYNNLMSLEKETSVFDLLNNEGNFNISNDYSQNKNNSYSFSFRYVQPVWTEVSFSFAYSGDFKTLWLRNNYYDFTEGIILDNTDKKLYQDYKEQEHSFSLGMSGDISKLRYYASMNFASIFTSNNNILYSNKFNSNYFNIIPEFSLFYKFNNSGDLRAAWTRRIRNPMNKELNPYVDYTDSSNITRGNPGLQPEKSDEYCLDYTFFGGDKSIFTGINYHKSWNGIESYTYLENDKTAVTSYKNITKSWGIFLHGSYSQQITDWFSCSLSFFAQQEEFNNNEFMSKTIPYNISFSPDIRFRNFLFQAELKYSSKYGSFQYSSPESYYVNMGIKTSIFEKRLFLYLKAKDIFNTLNRNSKIYGTGYISSVTTNETSRVISLGLSYYFQETESPEQRVEEEIEDDF